jgi:DNA-binding protein YbaB
MVDINPENFKKLEESMKQIQEKINAKTYSGLAGGDMVQAEVNGKGDIISLSINVQPNDLQNEEDIKTLADLVLTAVKKAQDSASNSIVDNMGSLFGKGSSMPDLKELIELTKDLTNGSK